MSPKRLFALIPAAGSSSRMLVEDLGCKSKLFLQLGDKPLIAHTLQTVQALKALLKIVVLAPADLSGAMREAINQVPGTVETEVVTGGASRQASVRIGLETLNTQFKPGQESYVLVHDAARCLASSALLERAVNAAFEHQAVTAAIPISDSLRRITMSGSEPVARDGMWAVQTPQVFRFDLLWSAHQQAGKEATDDASLVERLHPITLVAGELSNFKITRRDDYEFARRLGV